PGDAATALAPSIQIAANDSQANEHPSPSQSAPSAQTDADAIRLARAQDTVVGYNAFLAAFPSSLFAGEAASARDRLLHAARPFDVSQLESNAQDLVRRARSNEAGASTEAAQSPNNLALTRRADGVGVYRGSIAAGAANGLGRVVWGNGDVYAGSWRA